MEFNKYLVIIIIVIVLHLHYINKIKREVNIFIGNSFKRFYQLPYTPLYCENKNIIYICKYSSNKSIKYSATIYNGNKKFPNKTKEHYNIIITTEKLSQVEFMKDIGNGKSKYYQLAVDYRLFNNKWHISYPIYSDYNLNEFIQNAKSNFNNMSIFLKRKNIVYIQKVSYPNRQYIVKELMKYLTIDSYGKDLNNKIWPKNISIHNKIHILKNYKFCIAIENSIITWKKGNIYEAPSINNDYVTEKLTDCLLAGSIPIYFGPKNIEYFLPHPSSIINLRDYNSIKELSYYIKTIINNTKLLSFHLQWYNNISPKWLKRFNKTYSFNYCKICNYVGKA